ncbi:hypothetical protein Y1Q_0009273 [Alligator mississippiensis]|uniref:Uncharacterized protein n=1 Tax=Alligator mississippiensis TaxID=8496 RepID=A0A151NHE2_ALLMI|nr:hypothetical protein Y1Q_0009273 [Alligator mississippiensis]
MKCHLSVAATHHWSFLDVPSVPAAHQCHMVGDPGMKESSPKDRRDEETEIPGTKIRSPKSALRGEICEREPR